MTNILSAEKRLVAAGFVWFAMMGLAVTMSGPLSVSLGPAFRQPQANESQIVTALFAGSALMIALSVSFAKLFARTWVARFCGFSYATGMILCWMSPSWTLLLLGFGLIGLGNGGMSIWYNAEFARFFDGKRVGAWLSALNGFWAVGAVSGPLLLRQFERDPRAALGIVACIAVVALPLAVMVPTRVDPEHSEAEESVPVPRLIFGLMVLLGLYVGAETATLTLMSRYMMSVHAMSWSLATAVGSGLWFAFMVGRFGAGPIAARLHPSRLLFGCATLACVSLCIAAQPGLAMPGYIMLGLAMGPIFPTVIAWGTGLSPAAHRLTGIMVMGPCVTAVTFPGMVTALVGVQFAIMPWIIIGVHATIGVLALVWAPRSSPARG